jgi:hypothetical protein
MTERCGSVKGIENKLEQLVDVASSYIKSRETQDARWTVTREHGQDISVIKSDVREIKENYTKKECTENLEKEISKIDIELHGTDKQQENGYNGMFGEIRIMKAQITAIPSTINCLLEPITKSINEIKERNLKKDAISNWKLSLPAGLLTILSIIQIIMFFIKG